MTSATVTFLNRGHGSTLTTTARDNLEPSLLQLTAERKMSKNILTFTLMTKGLVNPQLNPSRKFHVVLFSMLYKAILTLHSVDEVLPYVTV